MSSATETNLNKSYISLSIALMLFPFSDSPPFCFLLFFFFPLLILLLLRFLRLLLLHLPPPPSSHSPRQSFDGQVGSDYINANYCDGYRKQNAYIATQGPLPETIGDFWRMAWEQRSSTIVMMTKLEERTRVRQGTWWFGRVGVGGSSGSYTGKQTTELS